MMKKIVVIGGVATGLKAASKARRCDPRAEITVIDSGDLVSYGACGLPFYIAGKIEDVGDLMKTPVGVQRNPGYFKNVKDINVLPRTLATAINRKEKSVAVKNLADGKEWSLTYDKLVIATGATAVKPDIPGIGLGRIFQLKHPHDAEQIREAITQGNVKKAVIIGAGLVGLEVAEAFHARGLEVTVIEMKEQVFPAVLDEEMAGIVEKYLTARNVRFRKQEKVLRFNGKETVAEVVTDKGVIPADIVLLSIGVRPNADLAKAAGLDIGVTGAIAVDSFMRTSDPDIYAGGDCVENTNIITGKKVFAPMGSTANKHGRIIGENICGHNVAFAGVLNTAAASMLGLNIAKTGLTEREAKAAGREYVSAVVAGHDKPHYMQGAKLITIKLIVDANSRKVLGAQAVGEGDVTKRIDVVAAVLTAGGTLDVLFDADLCYAPPFSSPIDNVAVAANAVMNKLTGGFKGISPLEAREKRSSDKTVFLDVRTPGEYAQIRLGQIKNLKHIPLGQLRSRLGELDKEQEVVAFCKISLRGYEAETILEGEGFKDVKVLEGGIAAWPFEDEK